MQRLEAPAESTTGTSAGTGSPAAPAAPAADAGAGVDLKVDAGEEIASVEEGKGEDWNELSTGEDLGEDTPAIAPAAVPAPAKPAAAPAPAKPAAAPAAPKPAAAPAPAAPAPAAPAVAPAPAPAPAAAPVAAPVAETPEAKVVRETAERTAAAAGEKQLFDGLVDYYKLPDDMAARLATEPEQVLPVLAARVHQAVVQGVQKMLGQELPRFLQNAKTFEETETKARDAFFLRWPSLSHKEHGKQVLQVGALFRQLNPNATPDEAIERIGRVVHEALGLVIPAAGPGGPAAGAPVALAAPAAPFKPAGGGGAPAAPAPSSNEFEQIAGQLLEEDGGTEAR